MPLPVEQKSRTMRVRNRRLLRPFDDEPLGLIARRRKRASRCVRVRLVSEIAVAATLAMGRNQYAQAKGASQRRGLLHRCSRFTPPCICADIALVERM